MGKQKTSQEIWEKVLETAQDIWKKSIENFDKLENNEKRKQFKNYLDKFEDEFEENSFACRIKKTRDSLTEEQKLGIYKTTLTEQALTLSVPALLPTILELKTIKHTIKYWKNGIKSSTLETFMPFLFRFYVQLGILEKPKWITYTQLKKDIKKDAKNSNLWLSISKRIASIGWVIQPETAVVLEPLAGLIGIIQHYTKWYEEEWTNVIIKRLDEKAANNIKNQTNNDLIDTFNKESSPTLTQKKSNETTQKAA